MARLTSAAILAALVTVLPVRRPAAAATTSCSVNSVTPLNFGQYDPLSAVNDDSVASVRYTCKGGATVVIGVSGMQFDGLRSMTASGSALRYNIYSDAARTQEAGEGYFGGSLIYVGRVPNSIQQTQQLYGRIPASQDVEPGTYTASVTVTIYF